MGTLIRFFKDTMKVYFCYCHRSNCNFEFLTFVFYLDVLVYWIQLQNIHTFTYQKTLLHTLFFLILKLSKAFSASLTHKIHKKFLYVTLPDVRWNPTSKWCLYWAEHWNLAGMSSGTNTMLLFVREDIPAKFYRWKYAY